MNKVQILNLPYQTEGIQWLVEKPARYLADDMGLGKTFQVIRAVDTLSLKRILVVCPAIARYTWKHEILKFSNTPESAIQVLIRRSELPRADTRIVICSFDYATQPQDPSDKKLKKITPPLNSALDQKWDAVVVDEGHFLKNIEARRTQAVLSKYGLIHKTRRAWFLSGTPMPNSLPSELWPVMFSLGVTKLNYYAFLRTYCNGYEDDYGYGRKFVPTGVKQEKVAEFKAMLSRFMLRRMKKDVLKDLPAVMYADIFMEGKISELPNLTDEQKSFLSNFSTTDPKKQMELLEMSAASISTLRRFCGLQKVESVAALISEELENNAYKKIVIFGIHKDVLSQLYRKLERYNPVLVNGEVDASDRAQRVHDFQHKPEARVFLGNIAAAGTNITLTSANQMFFIEEDFVPGSNQQAVDRCNRIGQTLPVTVRRAKLESSLDDKINEILYRKSRDGKLLLGA